MAKSSGGSGRGGRSAQRTYGGLSPNAQRIVRNMSGNSFSKAGMGLAAGRKTVTATALNELRRAGLIRPSINENGNQYYDVTPAGRHVYNEGF